MKSSEGRKLSNWKKPIIAYLQDPSQKSDKVVWRQALKYTMVDHDMYRRRTDDFLPKCLHEDQTRVSMGKVHDGLCGTHWLA
jgi:hypothetical protein